MSTEGKINKIPTWYYFVTALAGLVYLFVLGVSIKNLINQNDDITAIATGVSSGIGLIATFLAYKEKIAGVLIAVIQVPIGAIIVYWVWYYEFLNASMRMSDGDVNKWFDMMKKLETYSLNQSFVYSLFCGIPALLLLATLFVILKKRTFIINKK
jgi:hypothetical protein